MRLITRYMLLAFKSQMEYKLSFAFIFVSQFVSMFVYYFFINALFDRFGSLQQFSRHEVLLAFAAVSLGYGLAEITLRGFDVFSRLIVSGNFDRLLVRPRGLLLQVIGSEFYFARLSKVLQGMVILFYSAGALPIHWSADKVLVLLMMVVAAYATFAGVFILAASFCFVTIQGLEVMNILIDGGREAAQYPMAIYPKEFLLFFTLIIPLACANSYPLLYLVDRAPSPWYALTPLWSCFFVLPCCLIWLRLAQSYQSSGS